MNLKSVLIFKTCFKLKNCHFGGWQTSSGHNRRHFVDKRGDISWTLLVTSRGHFCPLEVLFLGDFSWTFLGDISWTFWVTFRGHSNDWSYIIIKQ